MENLSEKALWDSIKDGDLNAFSSFFKFFYQELYNYGLKITKGDKQLTEDSLQDFFLYIFKHRQSLASLTKIRPYLYTSFRRRIIKDIIKNQKNVDFDISEIDFPDINYCIEDILIKQEVTDLKRDNLTEYLNKLTKRQKEVLYLKYYSGLPTTEISTVLDIKYQSVLNIIHKTLKKLREDNAFKKVLKNLF